MGASILKRLHAFTSKIHSIERNKTRMKKIFLEEPFEHIEGKAAMPPPTEIKGKQGKQKRWEVGTARTGRMINEYSHRRFAFHKAEAFAQQDHDNAFYVKDRHALPGLPELFLVYFSELTNRIEVLVVRHKREEIKSVAERVAERKAGRHGRAN